MNGGRSDRRRGKARRGHADATRILIAFDRGLYRSGIEYVLDGEDDFEIVRAVANGRSALEAVADLTPDIILIELELSAPTGFETIPQIKRELPSAGIIVLAATDDEESLFAAIKAGAAAFLSANVDPDDLVSTIRQVVHGAYLINDSVIAKPAVAGRVLREFREFVAHDQATTPLFAPLSPREFEVLDHIAQGMSNKEVAATLSINEQTVKNHMSSMLRKLSLNDRTQAVVYAMRQGWIRLPRDS